MILQIYSILPPNAIFVNDSLIRSIFWKTYFWQHLPDTINHTRYIIFYNIWRNINVKERVQYGIKNNGDQSSWRRVFYTYIFNDERNNTARNTKTKTHPRKRHVVASSETWVLRRLHGICAESELFHHCS